MKALLFAAFLFTFSHSSHANNLDTFLHETTWCFEDKTGYWDHARLYFNFTPGQSWAYYDVTDAPRPGGTYLSWYSMPFFNSWQIVVITGKANHRVQSLATIVFDGHNRMIWNWSYTRTPSRLNRCRWTPRAAGSPAVETDLRTR